MRKDFAAACLAVMASLLLAASPRSMEQQPPARPALSEIQAMVAKQRAIVTDPYATEAALAGARSELMTITARLNELAPASPKRSDSLGPAAAAQREVRSLLASIEGRLGRAGGPAPGRNARAARAAGLSVPDFEDGRTTQDLANALRAAQARLSDQLRDSPAKAQQTEDLLVDMIAAEERLAWQAGWPFTPEEMTELKGLKEQARKAGGAKGDAGTQNELDRRIGEIYARRRARGVNVINAQLAHEASSVGREAPAPFVLHRPVTRAGQRAVERRLVEMIATEIGLQLQPNGPALLILSNGTKPFDDVLAGMLRGER